MASATNRYIREVLHHHEPPPAATARFFYTSTLAIDDPLSPLPPPAAASTPTAASRFPPHPFSEYDNDALDKAWHDLRRKILQYNEEQGEKSKPLSDTTTSPVDPRKQEKGKGRRNTLMVGRPASASDASTTSRQAASALNGLRPREIRPSVSIGADGKSDLRATMNALDGPALPADAEAPDTTGNPFIRAPSRKHVPQMSSSQHDNQASRPEPHAIDSYSWDSRAGLRDLEETDTSQQKPKESKGPSAKIAVGISRLHHVTMPDLQMEPIYWRPVNDIAPVMRGTWFYKDNMLPVETPVANMLEAGYVELKPWTETWADELNSALEVGAAGEMKILHRLWPEPSKARESRPGTARGEMVEVLSTADTEPDRPEKEKERAVETACDIIDISTGADGPDNKAAGTATFGYNGALRNYRTAGVIYANGTEAHILKPNLQPSAYYGRRPYANYIRKGRKLGIAVVRGFDQAAWDRLHPQKKSAAMQKAQEGVSTSQSGAPPNRRKKADAELAMSERPKVTDLVLVVHGIGQKLSERMESFHFTHAINAFRREVSVELGTDSVKSQLRKDMGGIMVLPVCILSGKL